jgi:hypothetical protein
MLPKKPAGPPPSNKLKLGLAIGLVCVAGAFMAYSLWGGPRPGQAEGTSDGAVGATSAAAQPTAPQPVANAPAVTNQTAAAPADKPNPYKEGGRMIPRDAKPAGN